LGAIEPICLPFIAQNLSDQLRRSRAFLFQEALYKINSINNDKTLLRPWRCPILRLSPQLHWLMQAGDGWARFAKKVE
jgi:hypothetical protein